MTRKTNTQKTTDYLNRNKVERIQAFINPNTEPDLLEAYLFLVEHYKGKKEALAQAIMNEYKELKSV